MNRRDWMKQSLLLPALARETHAERDSSRNNKDQLSDSLGRIRVHGSADSLWSLTAGPKTIAFAPPSFPIAGKTHIAVLDGLKRSGPEQKFLNGVSEQRFSGHFAGEPALWLELIFRIAPDSPVLRFRYVLHAPPDATLTGDGAQLRYFSISFAGLTHCLEIQLSNFNEMLHSYTVAEQPIAETAFKDNSRLAGPILVGSLLDSDERTTSLLVAYEHGAQIPDSFLEYQLSGNREVSLKARKANYNPGQKADGFSTVWMQAAASDAGIDQIAAQYRDFVFFYATST